MLWLLAAVGLVQYLEIGDVLRYDARVNWAVLRIGLAALGLATVAGAYCVVWLDLICKVKDYERHSPAAVPLATACGAVGIICSTIGLWPVWGWFTLVVMPILFMGCLVSLIMIPI